MRLQFLIWKKRIRKAEASARSFFRQLHYPAMSDNLQRYTERGNNHLLQHYSQTAAAGKQSAGCRHAALSLRYLG